MPSKDPSTKNDHIEADVGNNASHVNIGKDISSVSVGDVHGDIKDSIIAAHVNIHRLDPTDAHNQRNHRILRQLVKSFWIDGVLKHSLYNEVLIRLNLQEQPDKVDNRPWNLIHHQPGKADRLLPPNTSIIDVFDQTNQRLLILGEPGSGKTTILLELAKALLERASKDQTYQTPVVFNLSSWAAKRQSLEEWLIDELHTKYNIPIKIAEKWVKDDELLLLLDGFDEVRQEHRNVCGEAINYFLQEHIVPVAICSRMIEYKDITTQLKLQGAVMLQSLTLAQINDYLNTSDVGFGTIQSILQDDKELQEIATSPFILSIMAITYGGMSAEEISLDNSIQTRRRHLFNAYITRMFVHRDTPCIYSVHKTLRWLSWLAENINQRQQTIFLIEQLQPDWLHQRKQQWKYKLALCIVGGFLIGFVYMLCNSLGISLALKLAFGLSFFTSVVHTWQDITWVTQLLSPAFMFIIFRFLISYMLDYHVKPASSQTTEESQKLGKNDFIFILTVTVSLTIFGGLIFLFNKQRIYEIQDSLENEPAIFYLLALYFGQVWAISEGVVIGLSRTIESSVKIVFSWAVTKSVKATLILFALFASITFVFVPTTTVAANLGMMPSIILMLILYEGLSTKQEIAQQTRPNFGIRRSAQNMWIGGGIILLGLWISLIIGVGIWAILSLLLDNFYQPMAKSPEVIAQSFLLSIALLVGITSASTISGFLKFGGKACLQHVSLRIFLWWYGCIPWNYAHFLNYCVARIFLYRVGGGYIFIHRMLMEHFADMTTEDIERIAATVKESKAF